MQLEPIHERAIDLLVSGRRQIAVAKELNISTRTLRRWGADADFVAELRKQHELSRKLTAAAEDDVRRERREVQLTALKQIRKLIEDEKTPSRSAPNACASSTTTSASGRAWKPRLSGVNSSITKSSARRKSAKPPRPRSWRSWPAPPPRLTASR